MQRHGTSPLPGQLPGQLPCPKKLQVPVRLSKGPLPLLGSPSPSPSALPFLPVDGDAGLEWRQRHAEIVTAYGKLWEVVSVAGYGVAVKCGSPACSNSSSAAKAARLEDGKGVSGDEDGDAGATHSRPPHDMTTGVALISSR